MDARTLSEVMGGAMTLERYEQLLPGYINAMNAAGVDNPLRAAMFAAQLGHESVGLKYMEEIASGAAYEGRRDLGNVNHGDGVKFKGRGPIQLTGRSNYRAFTNWAKVNGHSVHDFEAEPWLLSQPHWGFLAAAYYWAYARPQINALSDRKDLEGVTRAINGGLNGLSDRRVRYNRALAMSGRLLPNGGDVVEKVLDYSRTQVTQDTGYNCGPASVQTVIQAATGKFRTESELGGKLGTHTGGTDYIGSFPSVLNGYLPDAGYGYRNVPDYPNGPQKDIIWDHIKGSIDAGYGVIFNIVAPPNGYPKAVYPSTISPSYSGGTVYHYFAVMGYSTDGQRKVWVADSGFAPYGYWLSFDQLCVLVVPKGYAFAAARATTNKDGGLFMSLSNDRQEEVAAKIDRIHHELTHDFPSRYVNTDGTPSTFRETLVGYMLELDRKVEDIHSNMLPTIYKAVSGIVDTLKGFLTKGGK